MSRGKPVIGHVRPAPGVMSKLEVEPGATWQVAESEINGTRRKLRVCQTENKALRADLKALADAALLLGDMTIEGSDNLALVEQVEAIRKRWGLA